LDAYTPAIKKIFLKCKKSNNLFAPLAYAPGAKTFLNIL
jgi:hypothetical protein